VSEGPCPTSPEVARRTILRVYAATTLGTSAWLAAIVLAPYLRSRGAEGGASFIYALFSPLCHQIPGRSFFFHGFPLAVCGRCFGIYSGFLAGLVLYPFVRGLSRVAPPAGRAFWLLSLPIGADFAASLLGLWQSTNGIRFATGLVWGVILPFYFVTGVLELSLWAEGRKGNRRVRRRAEARNLITPGKKP
jgi:uncharacterized membrane protein